MSAILTLREFFEFCLIPLNKGDLLRPCPSLHLLLKGNGVQNFRKRPCVLHNNRSTIVGIAMWIYSFRMFCHSLLNIIRYTRVEGAITTFEDIDKIFFHLATIRPRRAPYVDR